VTVKYNNTYNAANGKYEVLSVDISDVDTACVGLNLAITLATAETNGVVVGTGSASVAAGLTQNFAIAGVAGVNAGSEAIKHAAIVIAG
jgi:hypothetical protein